MIAQKSVLIVDSDEGMQHFLHSVLQRQNWQVRPARSALEALDSIRASMPGVIVIPADFLIRDGGWALAEHIRELEPQQPMVLLRTRGDQRERASLPGFGPCHVLDRPINIDVFTRCIRELLGENGHN